MSMSYFHMPQTNVRDCVMQHIRGAIDVRRRRGQHSVNRCDLCGHAGRGLVGRWARVDGAVCRSAHYGPSPGIRNKVERRRCAKTQQK